MQLNTVARTCSICFSFLHVTGVWIRVVFLAKHRQLGDVVPQNGPNFCRLRFAHTYTTLPFSFTEGDLRPASVNAAPKAQIGSQQGGGRENSLLKMGLQGNKDVSKLDEASLIKRGHFEGVTEGRRNNLPL